MLKLILSQLALLVLLSACGKSEVPSLIQEPAPKPWPITFTGWATPADRASYEVPAEDLDTRIAKIQADGIAAHNTTGKYPEGMGESIRELEKQRTDLNRSFGLPNMWFGGYKLWLVQNGYN